MADKKTIVEVFTPKPNLTIYRDTYLRCELICREDDEKARLKIISVHTGSGGLLSDLTAERVDEIILVDNDDVFYSLAQMKQFL